MLLAGNLSEASNTELRAVAATAKEMSKKSAGTELYAQRYGFNTLGASKIRSAFLRASSGDDAGLLKLGFTREDIDRMVRLEKPRRASMKKVAEKLGTSLTKVDNMMTHLLGSAVSKFDQKLEEEEKSRDENPFLDDY